MLARRPEKGGRREFLVRCGWLLSLLLPRLNLTGVFASVLLVCREGADVSFARTDKIQKVQPGVFARLAHTQQDEVFFNAIRGGKTFDGTAEPSKRFDRMLGVVVVPRDWQAAYQSCRSICAPHSPEPRSSLSGSHSSPHTRSCRGRPLA